MVRGNGRGLAAKKFAQKTTALPVVAGLEGSPIAQDSLADVALRVIVELILVDNREYTDLSRLPVISIDHAM